MSGNRCQARRAKRSSPLDTRCGMPKTSHSIPIIACLQALMTPSYVEDPPLTSRVTFLIISISCVLTFLISSHPKLELWRKVVVRVLESRSLASLVEKTLTVQTPWLHPHCGAMIGRSHPTKQVAVLAIHGAWPIETLHCSYEPQSPSVVRLQARPRSTLPRLRSKLERACEILNEQLKAHESATRGLRMWQLPRSR